MKKLFLSLGLIALLVGCKSAPQAIYATVGSTTVGVDVAMSEWGAYVAVQHPPVSQELAVRAAFQKYQAAMALVCDAGAAYAGSYNTNSTQLSGALETAIANANSSITDLETLITSFGVTLK